MNSITKPGKGRHGRRPTPDIRHSAETKAKAVAMFMAGQRPWAIAKALGVKFQTCYSWLSDARRELACVCAETSTRNCPTHQNAGRDEARAAVSDSDPGDES